MTRWTLKLDGSHLPEKTLIGGKGWSVARMAALGLTVPPAFVITTEACTAYRGSKDYPEGLEAEIADGIAWLEQQTGRTYGRGPSPLLVSVRSGAAISMPGMMDTVLNMGITPDTETALAEECGDPVFARDTHRRFHELYAHIVLKTEAGEFSNDETAQDWAARIETASGRTLPADPADRLHAAVRAVFDSWDSRRAKRYRKHHDIPDDLGTAVVVQAMVFGNMGGTSGTGVMFSRNPIDGEPTVYGEFLANAQGEDVVSGKFTPQRLDTMLDALPEAHDALLRAARMLEIENRDVQDIEFTVQNGTLYLLQARAAKRAPEAALKIICDMLDEGTIDEKTALSRITPDQVRSLLAPRLPEGASARAKQLARGEAASPGIGIGTVVTDSDEAERRAKNGEAVILARATTSPDDLHGMIAALAVVTERGGSTSHAAVVSRALGVPCVTGCGEGSVTALAGRKVTVDGSGGLIFDGELPVQEPDETALSGLVRLTRIAERLSPVKVILPEDALGGALDLNRVEGGSEIENLPRLLTGIDIAGGGALADDKGIAAGLRAGLKTIVGRPRLPILLAAIRGARPSEDRDTVAVSATE
ncbi:pyruvate, phosphate dikinase [Antarcticimicrobium luteum]|uniref:Pyruvate, phosphate dikinase n=1 Tax=Antarcticimicrobium luteum TaxID=2547397 RepID=A0A4R5V1U3_9RHOB|nr:pyruvate, phosphate dikinase [Antarcticimicrobium luteum]TDK45704.1 pyruvate, phosphate dikinase [Antarcticimicrobium luteum]